MGILDFMKKTHDSRKEEQEKKTTINLTKNAELNKKINIRKDILIAEVKERNILSDKARIIFALDHSGSMRTMYKNGDVQNVLERIFPLAMYFDDNGEMEFYWFDDTYKELTPVNGDTLENYVENHILSHKDHFGGTCYAPIMNEITERYAIREPSSIPTFVIFITDGSNSDKKDSKNVLTKASEYNIFWKFIGIGKEEFPFLEKLDDLKGRCVDNANYISVNNLDNLSDKELYSALLEEYNDWLQAIEKK